MMDLLPPKMTSSLFTQIAKEAIVRDRTVMEAVRMTQRETEVIALIGDGLSNKEIASRRDLLQVAPQSDEPDHSTADHHQGAGVTTND